MIRSIGICLFIGACISMAIAQLPKLSGELPDGQIQPAGPSAWWSDRTAGWAGGIGGSVIGICGGLVGTLAGIGKARRLVLILMAAVVVLGIASFVIGVIALTLRQPYGVYYPLLLLGIVGTGVFGGLFPVSRNCYRQRELRKMEAMDAG